MPQFFRLWKLQLFFFNMIIYTDLKLETGAADYPASSSAGEQNNSLLTSSASGTSNSNVPTMVGSVIGSIGALLLCLLASWLGGLCRRRQHLPDESNAQPSAQVLFPSCSVLNYDVVFSFKASTCCTNYLESK